MANKALLVGINDYKSSSDLRGCINDITNMRHVLNRYYNFEEENISLVADGRATKNRLRKRLEWLMSDLSDGDHIVFHFSGHGSYIKDIDGDERKRVLNDDADELICLYGMDWDDPDSYIIDDELREWANKKPENVSLTIVLDCCHSGTGTRDFAIRPPASLAPTILPVEEDLVTEVRSRFMAPPIDILSRTSLDEHPSLMTLEEDMNHMLLAGCDDWQTSADAFIDGAYNGAFTYYLCKTIREGGHNLSYSQMMLEVHRALKFNGYSQNPQCEGPFENNQLFAPIREAVAAI